MHQTRSGPAAASTTASPVEQPRGTDQNRQTCVNRIPADNNCHARTYKPRFTISDAAAWAIATLVVGTVLIAACVVLTLGWPA